MFIHGKQGARHQSGKGLQIFLPSQLCFRLFSHPGLSQGLTASRWPGFGVQADVAALDTTYTFPHALWQFLAAKVHSDTTKHDKKPLHSRTDIKARTKTTKLTRAGLPAETPPVRHGRTVETRPEPRGETETGSTITEVTFSSGHVGRPGVVFLRPHRPDRLVCAWNPTEAMLTWLAVSAVVRRGDEVALLAPFDLWSRGSRVEGPRLLVNPRPGMVLLS
ncbi:hypothetical protein BR93DRAFT_57403 [Coniochaeta sp. PMI_546]|nr:hypothetical protein BR93DRAFT_57403 [Coniochaeta sp. PMI_546]